MVRVATSRSARRSAERLRSVAGAVARSRRAPPERHRSRGRWLWAAGLRSRPSVHIESAPGGGLEGAGSLSGTSELERSAGTSWHATGGSGRFFRSPLHTRGLASLRAWAATYWPLLAVAKPSARRGRERPRVLTPSKGAPRSSPLLRGCVLVPLHRPQMGSFGERRTPLLRPGGADSRSLAVLDLPQILATTAQLRIQPLTRQCSRRWRAADCHVRWATFIPVSSIAWRMCSLDSRVVMRRPSRRGAPRRAILLLASRWTVARAVSAGPHVGGSPEVPARRFREASLCTVSPEVFRASGLRRPPRGRFRHFPRERFGRPLVNDSDAAVLAAVSAGPLADGFGTSRAGGLGDLA